MTDAAVLAVAWHDTECGSYDADLALWNELAASAGGGSVVDCGAGTGRVTIPLAAAGHEVVACDVSGDLLAELERRAAAAGVAKRVRPHEGDVRRSLGVESGEAALVLGPMQLVQILGGRRGRAAFLRAAAAALRPGGVVALAIAGDLAAFSPGDGPLPAPDILDRDGRRYASQPVAVVINSCVTRIERLRRIDDAPAVADSIALDRIAAADVVREAAAAGLAADGLRAVSSTPEHVGSTVVVLHKP